MTLEENIKAILECNFAIAREEVIEATTQRIMEQISRQNPLEEELKKVKAEIDDMLKSDEVKNDKWANVIINKSYLFKRIINKHIAELKGENNG